MELATGDWAMVAGVGGDGIRINKRSETVDEKIKKLDAELARYEEQIKKTQPGPAQEAVKARAMRVLKQKRTYEGQRDMLYNQTFNLDQVEFASEGIKDAKQTVCSMELLDMEMDALEALFSESNAVSFDFILPQLILLHSFQMSALQSANKKLKKMTKTLQIQDIVVCI
ncbi:hypothetical protein HYC85_015185 [Camellia sinensis]|uniref:Uncharacterized protein n=1 Tax=Camellia sinensis TaxID=4442 RepID=A0A7J7HBM1_CAMSI|nr:hypothetical protein HYC85_015185 [Camellia sinensis]